MPGVSVKSIGEMVERINVLREKRRAVILAHNYQLPEVQDIADYVGDSLELARKALETDADVIVFAGVAFMAELAAILNPDRIVLHPEPSSGCPLANYLSVERIRRVREKHPGIPLILYVNSTAAAKYYADYIVTSASAVKLVERLGADEVLFGPDRNLADYVAEKTGKRVIPVPRFGHCPVHQYLISEYHVLRARERYPRAKILIHPEAPREARRHADYVGSTSQMLRAIPVLGGEEFLLGTEEGLAYRARRLYPDKKIMPLYSGAICINMKKITLLHIMRSLENMKPIVRVPEHIAGRVRETMIRSLEMIK